MLQQQLSEKEKFKADSKMEKLALNEVPMNAELLYTKHDDDPNKMETMSLEESDIPMNMRMYGLVHVMTQEGDELIRMIWDWTIKKIVKLDCDYLKII